MSGRTVLGHRVQPPAVVAAFLVLGTAGAVVVAAGAPWWAVVAGVVGPDLTFLAAGVERPAAPGLMPRRAVTPYNAAHRPLVPLLLAALGVVLSAPTLAALGLAWLSHIVWDRGVGYGLRDADGAMLHQRHLLAEPAVRASAGHQGPRHGDASSSLRGAATGTA